MTTRNIIINQNFTTLAALRRYLDHRLMNESVRPSTCAILQDRLPYLTGVAKETALRWLTNKTYAGFIIDLKIDPNTLNPSKPTKPPCNIYPP